MTVIQKTIGRLPVNLGDYDSTKSYGKKNRVLLYGCEWESKVENNTYAPASLNTTTGIITPDTTHWKLISGSYNTWLIDNGYKKVDAVNVKDGNKTQHEINVELANADNSLNNGLSNITNRVSTAEGNITSLGGRLTTAEGNITLLGGRLTTAEGNITSLGGRVSTNETDIANLQELYNDLQQSKPVPVTALPTTGQQQGVIYRLAGTTSYSDYMWNGSTWVLMATYNNAIDDKQTIDSNNLVKSGGVWANTLFDDIYFKFDNLLSGLWLATGSRSGYADWKCCEIDMTNYRGKLLRIRGGYNTKFHDSCYIKSNGSVSAWLQNCLYKSYEKYNLYLIPSDADTLLFSFQYQNTGYVIPMIGYEPSDDDLRIYNDEQFLSYIKNYIDYSQIAEDGYYGFGSTVLMPYEAAYGIVINVNEGERYRVKGKIWANICLWNIADANGTVISNFTWEGAGSTSYPQTTFEDIVEIPKGGVKLYFSAFKTGPVPFIEQVPCFTPEKNKVNEAMKNLIGKTICIGDSTTYGFNNTSENAHWDSTQQLYGTYPKYFSRMIDFDVINAGAPAQGAKSYYNVIFSEFANNIASCEFVIINLGTNYGLTDTLAADTAAASYQDYANTNTGCYCKIIENILELNPHIHIALSYPQCRTGLVEPDETMEQTSMAICIKVIDEIAEKYGLFVLDDRKNYKVPQYQASDNVHFTRVGNLVRARTFLDQICQYINTHKELWKIEYINSFA